MILFWLAGFWLTMQLCRPEIRKDKFYLLVWDLTLQYILWPFTLGDYLRSKLEKE